MNPRWLELAARRGELRARCAMQRAALARDAWPVEHACAAADQAIQSVHWLKGHPAAVGAAVAALVVLRPQRAWRWMKRSFVLWRGWKALRSRLLGGGRG